MLALWLVGCVYVELVPGSGVSGVEERTLGAFDRLANDGEVDVRVEIDPTGPARATVTCDDNLLHLIRTRAVGDTLIVDHPFGAAIHPRVPCEVLVRTPQIQALEANGVGALAASGDLSGLAVVSASGTGAVTVDGFVPDLDLVEASGVGDVQVDGIDAVAPFTADASGVGQIRLSGAGTSVDLRSSGTGGIDARALVVSVATVDLSGTGDVWITATEAATIDVSGTGDVHLFGDPPDVSADTSGVGEVVYE